MDNDKETFFSILRLIKKNPYLSQRKMAANLNLSLGKLNYCIKALKDKGFLKIKNFKNNKNKLNYIYLLTPKGIYHKTQLTINFLKVRAREYDELKKELKNFQKSKKASVSKKIK